MTEKLKILFLSTFRIITQTSYLTIFFTTDPKNYNTEMDAKKNQSIFHVFVLTEHTRNTLR